MSEEGGVVMSKMKDVTHIPKAVRDSVYERDSYDGCPCCQASSVEDRSMFKYITTLSEAGAG